MFNENKFYVEWEKIKDNSYLIRYISIDEDLDDILLISLIIKQKSSGY